MNYISTRGQMAPIGFQDAVMTGLAPDGGLLLPEQLPNVTEKLDAWSKLSYPELAFEVIRLFATDIPADDLQKLVNDSYAAFDHPEVAPSVAVGEFEILELFHGPTLAFKDVALQFLGNLFEYILEKRGGRLNILGATSGDTGSAAIHGVRGKPAINIFIMHPEGRTSPLQEKQMTSVLDDNVFNLAVDGTFDDCQNIMKTTFGDVGFKTEHSLGSVNSVNWARVLAQTVYYFYAAFKALEKTGAKTVQFSVPTGNFGDILAGYLAQRMGLPISKLILATNENDILSRFFNSGTYGMADVVSTISPSMDIQVASNFERYLYYKAGQDASKLVALMDGFKENGSLSIELNESGAVDDLFVAGRGDTAATMATIKKYHDQCGYVLDPHTAVGVYVAEQFKSADAPTICLATAHPAKFTQAIIDAIGKGVHHPTLDALADVETRCDAIANDVDAVKEYLVGHI
ncbi:threonine synthase [Pontiella sulfatireligans]|uniref:Threonine synthase n=1 Tax=Pontiella sulfatireligans TaxID=2750658 RepID=A0A6C2UID5_9BACT|nr:threonine synthase [Pontiella sulfatireligans]VGO19965.1 Threonine synthase [Pontiella sulfatireligans]